MISSKALHKSRFFDQGFRTALELGIVQRYQIVEIAPRRLLLLFCAPGTIVISHRVRVVFLCS